MMRLVHTLLFLLREDKLNEDLEMAEKCLRSLEKSTYKTVVIFNQGFWDRAQAQRFFESFELNCIVIGGGTNVGIVAGRQGCFEYIWQNLPDAEFISELHLDMIFTYGWEDALVDYLDTHDDPQISCGIVDGNGILHFADTAEPAAFGNEGSMDEYLAGLKRDTVVHGFTHPCIHKSAILRDIGGYNTRFLTGMQAFEDDSLLLGYYYYYGTKANWKPKVCHQSVVYHKVAGQRMDMTDSIMVNFNGLVRQYGAMGLKNLAQLHSREWHVNFFTRNYEIMQDGGIPF